MIRIKLYLEECDQLKKIRTTRDSDVGERCLYVLYDS